jgi:hypothetical protein
MDLRPLLRRVEDLDAVYRLVGETHFIYQPFIFADNLEVGIGYESICDRPGGGMVYWPNAPLEKYPMLERFLLQDSTKRAEFSTANARLRRINDHYVDQICALAGDIRALSVADVGCFAGYFPVSFAARDARESVGYDIDDRSGCFAILNRLLGTNARFIHAGYDVKTGEIAKSKEYDIVMCHDLVQHMVEPLRFIRSLSRMAKQHLFLKFPCWLDSTGDYYITMGQPYGISRDPEFPWCFDHDNIPSWALLEKCLRLCGFTRITPIETYSFPQSAASAARQFVAFCVLASRD